VKKKLSNDNMKSGRLDDVVAAGSELVADRELEEMMIPGHQSRGTEPEGEEGSDEAEGSGGLVDGVAVEVLRDHAEHESHHQGEEQEHQGDGGAEGGEE